MRARLYIVWLLGMMLIAGIVVYGHHAIRMQSVARAKALHVKELQRITTIEEAERAGWMWTPGGTLIPPECAHGVPAGAVIHDENPNDAFMTLNGKVIERWGPCPVKGFRSNTSE